jgi:endo-1,4-beta-D-glucanase Y
VQGKRTIVFIIIVFLILSTVLTIFAFNSLNRFTKAAPDPGTVISSGELESNAFTTINGQCSPGINSTTVTFFCNESGRTLADITFPQIPGEYNLKVWGASTNTSSAGISLRIDNQVVGNLSWNSTSITAKEKRFNMQNTSQSIYDLSFVMVNDTGANDTIIDRFELTYVGEIVSRLPPTVPSTGAVYTNNYRNMFVGAGYTSLDANTKIDNAWDSLFYGQNNGNKSDNNNESVYIPVGNDMAFIEDINNGDIRSEGQSYGMMIAVQMDKKEEFDKLWKFAKTYMLCPRANQCQSGSGKEGYFSWQLNKTAPFTAIDEGSAPDGEEYLATALIFAGTRWGNNGSFNYHQDAQNILNAMLNDNRPNSMRSQFNLQNKVIVFAPIGNSANLSDPSYHLPSFYEVWAEFDSNPSQKTFWKEAAEASRAYWKTASGFNSGRTNGLMPDCSDLAGNAINGCAGGAVFAFDAWRAAANVAVDYAWWADDSWEVQQSNNFLNFFGSKRPSYQNKWNLDGTPIGSDFDSKGLISMNAVTGLASTEAEVWDFIDDIWNLEIPKGQYRYYDGLLYLMGLLHLNGDFKAWISSPSIPSPTSNVASPSPSSSPTTSNVASPSPTTTMTSPTTSTTLTPSISPSPTPTTSNIPSTSPTTSATPTGNSPTCLSRKSKADFNCSGKVDILDFSVLAVNWQKQTSQGDVNGDGAVNLVDFSVLALNWGKTLG